MTMANPLSELCNDVLPGGNPNWDRHCELRPGHDGSHRGKGWRWELDPKTGNPVPLSPIPQVTEALDRIPWAAWICGLRCVDGHWQAFSYDSRRAMVMRAVGAYSCTLDEYMSIHRVEHKDGKSTVHWHGVSGE